MDTVARLDEDRWSDSIKNVEEDGSIELVGGGHTGVLRVHDVTPAPGDHVIFWGSKWGPIRGAALNGKVVFHRTAAQQQAKHEAEVAEAQAQRKADFYADTTDADARYDALPDVFRRRIDRFRRNNRDFRWQYEGYEVATCQAAVAIADACGTGERVVEFQRRHSATPYTDVLDDQIDIDLLGLSGNQFGVACHLAYWALTDEDDVVKMHGAMSPLVGSEEYGDISPDGVLG